MTYCAHNLSQSLTIADHPGEKVFLRFHSTVAGLNDNDWNNFIAMDANIETSHAPTEAEIIEDVRQEFFPPPAADGNDDEEDDEVVVPSRKEMLATAKVPQYGLLHRGF